MPEPQVQREFFNLLPGKSTDEPVTRNDLERAIWTLTGWQLDATLVCELLLLADGYALAVAAGTVSPHAGDPDQVRAELLADGWLPSGPLPITWENPVNEARQAAMGRVREGASDAVNAALQVQETPTGEDVRILALAVEKLVCQVWEVLEWAQEPGVIENLAVPVPRTPDPWVAAERKAEPEAADPVAPVGERECSKCAVTRPLTEYNKDSKGVDGLRRYCRECERVQRAQRKKTPRGV